ncbi:MAG: hypothetical protein ACI9B8_002795, partial [Sulfitobacter sp.]
YIPAKPAPTTTASMFFIVTIALRWINNGAIKPKNPRRFTLAFPQTLCFPHRALTFRRTEPLKRHLLTYINVH